MPSSPLLKRERGRERRSGGEVACLRVRERQEKGKRDGRRDRQGVGTMSVGKEEKSL